MSVERTYSAAHLSAALTWIERNTPNGIQLVARALSETYDGHYAAPKANRTFLADPTVVDKRGRIKAHPFEPPHDDPGPGPFWFCLKPRDAKVHQREASRG